MENVKSILKPKLHRLDLSIASEIRADKYMADDLAIDDKPKETKQDYSGFVVIRLSENIPVLSDACNTLSMAARELRLSGLENVLDQFDLFNSRRLVCSMPPSKLLDLEQAARKTVLPPLHSLTLYWKVDVQEKFDQIDEIVKHFNSLKEVDVAYQELRASDPVVDSTDDPYCADQDYLDAAPAGIDARWAWTQPNGEGAGIALVDLEQGWFPSHEDLAGKSPTLIYGDNRDGVGTYKGNHGTAVLGQIVADDNTIGCVGVAPAAASVSMTSHYDAATGTDSHVADAIIAALPSMNAGDFLLLEIQRSFLPTETDDADFDAIRLAVSQGIVVIEAAGNGNNNLDTYANGAGSNILNTTSADFRESGAILVGASESSLPHDRSSFSNYGSRMDCYAWGDSIVTCGYGDLDAGSGDNSTYTDSFGGTSGASPIVTGAGMILQGMYQANTGTLLSPLQLRALLSDPTTGTAQGGGRAGNIGVMPNLRAIIENTLNIIPDVYLRDNVGDTGAVPSSGGISASPDIIVRNNTVADPQAAFGQGSGTENSNSLGYEVEAGQDNYVYVRMKNRGGQDAANVTASVYWSEVSTLVTPDMWTLLGTSPVIDVPQGDSLVVTNPITWNAGDIPGTGHYCFVGILEHPNDPAPPTPSLMDWNQFREFIMNYNNVTWRNFNVVDLDPNQVDDPNEIPFIIAGAPDESRVFDLELMMQLNKGVRVWLEVPTGLAKQFFEGREWKYEHNREKQTVRMLLPSAPKIFLPEMKLGKAARNRAKFIVEGVKESVKPGNWIAISQRYKKEEVGRVTWQFEARKTNKNCL